jgi:hypothetical protein
VGVVGLGDQYSAGIRGWVTGIGSSRPENCADAANVVQIAAVAAPK